MTHLEETEFDSKPLLNLYDLFDNESINFSDEDEPLAYSNVKFLYLKKNFLFKIK